jgi:hypothetical protein
MANDGNLRASDEQRDRAAAEIREHYAAGRLTDEEMTERLQGAYDARTVGDINALLADLPKLPATRAEQKAEIAQRRHELQRRLLQEAGGGSGAFIICTVIWLASGASGFFWPIFVALATLIPLLKNGWRLYGPAPEFDEIERELEARRHKNEARAQIRSEARSRAGRHSDRHRRERS